MGKRADNLVLSKAKEFAIRIINLYKFLTSDKHEYVISKQILRSGTSIGANINEAQESISHNEFTSKIYIALKEARETEYWLELLYKTEYLNEDQYININTDCVELIKLMVSITKTLRSK